MKYLNNIIFSQCVSGEQLVVFRDEKGEAHILDAYCPHMGANLGVGGRVVGDCIECPFHGWKFRGYDGKCTEVPYSEKGKLCFAI
jgi:cholesterol 7-dehydrogenase